MKKMIILVLALILINTMNSFGQDDFRKSPYILLKENKVTIMWQFYEQEDCTISWADAAGNPIDSEDFDDNDDFDDHLYSWEIPDLAPGVYYNFTVSFDTDSKSGSFFAPPSSTENEVSFYGYGDTRGGPDDDSHPPFHNRVCGKILEDVQNFPESQTILIHAADWNYYSTEMQWDSQYFYKVHQNAVNLRTKVGVVGCVGNHESSGVSTPAPVYRKYWPYNYSDPYPEDDSVFWHSYDYGPVHFCFIDQRKEGQPLGKDSLQKIWIKNDLETSTKDWNILVFHPPVYTSKRDPDTYNAEKEFFDEICNDPDLYGVNLLLNGHVHNYSDWLVNGVHHLTIGGGGSWKDPNEPNLPEDDPYNPNYIRYHTDFNYVKFDVFSDYIKVKTPRCIDNYYNIWEIYDEFIIPKSFTIKNGENIVWEDHGVHYYADQIVVENGGVLTIEGDVDFQRDGKIIVKRGGQLYLDGSTLSCIDNDEVNSWLGIEVWGDKNESQQDSSGIYKQGYLELNNATIKNAETAISLFKEGSWTTYSGGIIKAYNSEFINNTKAVHFHPYQNMVTIGNDPAFEADNVGIFRNCLFTINDQYTADSQFCKHADVVEVKRIKFYACDFKRESIENTFLFCSGIEAYDGGLSINKYINDSCTFEGLYSGIVLTNTNTLVNYDSYIQNSVFTNNSRGIKINDMKNIVSIKDNTFHVGYNDPDKGICGASQAYGIFLDNSNTFVIEDNAFDKYINAPSDGAFIGIEAFNTKTQTDEIYKNTFSGLTHANHAENQNWLNLRETGLEYYCNQHSNNNNDLFFVFDDPNNQSNSGVQLIQGNILKSTGNTFTQNISGYNLYNNTGHDVDYYYNVTLNNEIPFSYTSTTVNPKPQILAAVCSGGGIDPRALTSTEKQSLGNDFNISSTNYDNVKTLYESLNDGGNTQSLNAQVSTSWPNDMWELRAELLGLSPYLSAEVLKTAADKTEVLPESVLFEILSANPDELKKADLMQYLENKEQPLPDYMISILEQLAEGETAKTIMLNDMSRYDREKSRTALQMLVSLPYDEVFDFNTYRIWLNNLGGINNDRKIVASFVQEGNYSDALALAEIFPDLYNLENDDLTEFNYYMDMLNLDILLKQEDRSPMALSSTELNMVETIAENCKGSSGVQARGLLEHFYGQHFCNCVNTTVDVNKSASASIKPNEFAEAMGLRIQADPNPATTWVNFNYELPIASDKGQLLIRNTEGKQIALFQFSDQLGQKVWDTRSLKSGTYIYEFVSGELKHTGKIVIIK